MDKESATTGSSEVCRQCMECGVKYGQRKKTRDVIAWAKKKRRLIKREELLAFLLDKPDPSIGERMDEFPDLPNTHPRHIQTGSVAGLNCLQAPCYSNPLSSPRRRALFRDDANVLNDSEMFNLRENGRKRLSSNPAAPFDYGTETPLAKRMRL